MSYMDWRRAKEQAQGSGPRVSFADRQMTTREKAEALVSFGLADDMDEALAQLVDMGECDQAAADAISQRPECDEDDEPDDDDEDEWDDEDDRPFVTARAGQTGGAR